MCCCQTEQRREETACCGVHHEEGRWLSKKKRVEALKEELARLESRAEDIREYLRESGE